MERKAELWTRCRADYKRVTVTAALIEKPVDAAHQADAVFWPSPLHLVRPLTVDLFALTGCGVMWVCKT